MKTLQEQINEQIELANKIKAENPSVSHIMTDVSDVSPDAIIEYSEKIGREIAKSNSMIMLQVYSELGVAVFIKSTPVKFKSTKYEYETI